MESGDQADIGVIRPKPHLLNTDVSVTSNVETATSHSGEKGSSSSGGVDTGAADESKSRDVNGATNGQLKPSDDSEGKEREGEEASRPVSNVAPESTGLRHRGAATADSEQQSTSQVGAQRLSTGPLAHPHSSALPNKKKTHTPTQVGGEGAEFVGPLPGFPGPTISGDVTKCYCVVKSAPQAARSVHISLQVVRAASMVIPAVEAPSTLDATRGEANQDMKILL